MKATLTILLSICFWGWAAALTVSPLFSDHMVIQRDMSVRIWGTAKAGQKVVVTYKTFRKEADTGTDGNWYTYLDPLSELTAFDLTVTAGDERIVIADVVPGDVFVCSGQSNMEWKMGQVKAKYPEEAASCTNPMIRFIDIENTVSVNRLTDPNIRYAWRSIEPATLDQCSAVAYFYAKKLNDRYGVPVGLILSEWGGTPAEAWVSYGSLRELPHYQKAFDAYEEQVQNDKTTPEARQMLYQEWLEKLDALDSGHEDWRQTDFDDSEWPSMKAPKVWEAQRLDLDGIVVLRRAIEIPEAMLGRDLTLHLQKIDDDDVTYFNGVKIGATDGWDIERHYTIPKALLRRGKNVISVRVRDTGGGGGFHGDATGMTIEAGAGIAPVIVSGDWKYRVSADAKTLPPKPSSLSWPNQPCVLFNGMIAPISSFAIRGVIWYQGESNADRATEYRTLMPTLIKDWRREFAIDMPFFIVQLAAYMAAPTEPSESSWAALREAQALTCREPMTGMACAIDIGQADDIHPANKRDVGERLALHAMAQVYGESIETSGPTYKSMKIKDERVVLEFDHAKKLATNDGQPPRWFAVAGEDHVWYWAKAEIKGNNKIEVWSEKVAVPVAVRYAWADNPEAPNVYNAERLPMVPFRTDDW